MPIQPERRITVCAKRFFAAWQFISTEETRYYLNGVFIEPHPDGGVTMTATDGHTLASIRDRNARFDGKEGWICRVPKQPFNTLLKHGKSGHLHFVGNSVYLTDRLLADCDVLDPEYDPAHISPRHMAVAFCEPIDGTFPAWRLVVPRKGRARADNFALNGRLIARFSTAIKCISPTNSPTLHIFTPNDDAHPVVIRCGTVPDFFGIQMPMRDDTATRMPDWLKLPRKKSARKPKAANDTVEDIKRDIDKTRNTDAA
ncbi:hypothetical protein TH9_12355 [Thalassospira xiamenensis]|uniref:hypothetical protein n=1 Tax=Thalassospira xiamenensis TaxID=220697 RepID=UPI000DF8B39F|nr:hypothetical protein [Thalassospira xiamenensis]RCK32513.1 hypothetical protein TH9_12355 [Thalassospira xiamenensis]